MNPREAARWVALALVSGAVAVAATATIVSADRSPASAPSVPPASHYAELRPPSPPAVTPATPEGGR